MQPNPAKLLGTNFSNLMLVFFLSWQLGMNLWILHG